MGHFAVGKAVRWIIRVVCETSRAQHSLIAGDPATGPRQSRAIIVKPLSVQEKHQRSLEDVEREDGVKWAPGPDSVLRQACSTQLGIVQKRFAEAPV
jgi:hypothetical protein